MNKNTVMPVFLHEIIVNFVSAGGPHAIQVKRGEVKTPFTNQAINQLEVSAKVTHSG